MSGPKKIGKTGGNGGDSPSRETDSIVEQEMENMLRDSLKEKLGAADPSIVKEMNHQLSIDNPSFNSFYQTSEINSSKNAKLDKNIKRVSKTEDPELNESMAQHINYEAIAEKSLSINEKLISIFSKHNKILAKDSNLIIDIINSNQYILREIGIEFEKFNPDDYISGLEMPDQETTIKLVVANTKKFYKMSKIISYEIKNSTLIIDFAGINSLGENFFVRGKITPKRSWNGNEVIDYVYAETGGKMFVRAISIGENIKWSNQSDLFDIKYKLIDNVEKDSIDNKIQEGLAKIEDLDKANQEEESMIEQMVLKMKNMNHQESSRNIEHDNEEF